MRRFVTLLAGLAVSAALLAGCDQGSAGLATDAADRSPEATGTFTPSASVAASPTRPLQPDRPPRTRGAVSPTCVEGWRTPAAGTSQFTDPLGIVRRSAPVDGEFVVVDMRYFSGPESPPSDKGYILEIDRWYIKLFVESDWTYAGRFIVEARRFGRGVAAVAPYGTRGFRSPDWTGFQWESADPKARSYPGLPGRWSGQPYDFVGGGGGLDIPGLPAEVRGCLAGT